MNSGAASRRIALALMLASGFAGLGYQIVWTQQCSLWLGHESAGVLAVVAAFFGGLAIGAALLGTRIERSARPVRWYALCEATIAAWSLVFALCMAPVSARLLALIGAQPTPLWQWSVAFCGTFLLLLPATAAMGATLPAMERIVAGLRGDGQSIAALYAANTFGAVLGVLACAFWLVPELGLVRTAAVCVVLNLLCAVAASLFFSASAAASVHSSLIGSHAAPGVESSSRNAHRALLWRLALTGLLGIGFEVLVVRVLSQVEEDTVYTFAMLLAIYLVGSAIGASVYQRWLARRDADRLTNLLLCALALTCLAGTASLWFAASVKEAALQLFGSGMSAALAAETLLALLAFGPPTLAMGATFSHLGQCAERSGVGFGRALAVNTLGAAIAPLLFGVLLFPALGPKSTLLLVCGGYLALISWRWWRKPAAWLPATAVVAAAVFAPPLAFIDVPEGGRVVSYREGVLASVSVVEDAEGVARLRIDNRQQEGSSSSLRVDSRQALLPVLLHTAPRHVLFLGLGTGATASSAAADPTLQVDAVELLPEVIEASRYFREAMAEDSLFAATLPAPDAAASRLRLIAADARRYVRAGDRHYDVIISDNFHPARSGSGALYTVEHFAAVRERLAADGIFCQWLPLHQLDLDTLRSIVRSFGKVYPNGSAILASNSLQTPVLGLVGRADDGRFDIDALRARMASAALRDTLGDVGIDDEFALLGSFVAGPKALRQFAGSAPLNTDDRPVVAYRAPRITYAPDSMPGDRLIELLHAVAIEPDEVVTAAAGTDSAQRLAAYWQARDRFIESGRAVRPVANASAMLAQVREPLLSVLRISPDFRPAYDPLLMMAASVARSDAATARALLSELARLQPARPEAELALRGLGAVN